MEKEREVVKLTNEELKYFDFTSGDEWELRQEKYEYVKTIRTDHLSDGESWDTIVKRESDGKFFKWGCWDSGEDYVMEHGDNCMIEVFPETVEEIKYI